MNQILCEAPRPDHEVVFSFLPSFIALCFSGVANPSETEPLLLQTHRIRV